MRESKNVVCFGELLMRLATRNFERLIQADEFSVAYTGAEANVAVSLAQFGVETFLVSRVPPTEIGDACINFIRRFGVHTDFVVRGGSRLGLFFLETGAAQRPAQVIYDRAHSAITELRPGTVTWGEIFSSKDWFHLSGTAPALSRNTAEVVLEACQSAQSHGVKISVDLNYRRKLWQWDGDLGPRELAERTVRILLPHVDVLIANEEDLSEVLGIRAGETDVGRGYLDIHRYPDVARQVARQFPRLTHVAITLRESISASQNNWGAMLYDVRADKVAFAPEQNGHYEPYRITHIVDRVGAGDSFSAGLLFGFLSDMTQEDTVAFAAAASCLKHSIPGDFNLVSEEEVLRLLKGDSSGRVQR